MSRLTLAALAVLSIAAAPLARAEVLWRGDFESGDVSQWTRTQQISPDRLQIVESPVNQGRYALRAEVRQGDDPINASGNRNELVQMTNETEGDERWYAWSTLWPSDYPMTPTWQVFTQWHHSGSSGAPPVRLVVGCSAADCGAPLPDTMFFIVTGQNVWTRSPVVRGVWHNFVLHVKWSSSGSVGFVELWYDGEQVVPKTYRATLYAGQSNYLKQGLYRDEATSATQVLFHDGFVVATSRDDVSAFMKVGPVEPGTPDGGGTPPPPPPGGQEPVIPGMGPAVGCNTVGSTALTAWPAALAGLAFLRLRRRRLEA